VELLPIRLDFYEEWLGPTDLVTGRIRRAPLNGVLSFLRQEGEPYGHVMARAGALAAEWWLADAMIARRVAAASGPLWLRGRVAMGLCSGLVRQTFRDSRVKWRWRASEGICPSTGVCFARSGSPERRQCAVSM
jgi:hypothetical protein